MPVHIKSTAIYLYASSLVMYMIMSLLLGNTPMIWSSFELFKDFKLYSQLYFEANIDVLKSYQYLVTGRNL